MTEKKLLCLICRNMQQRETQNSFTVNIQVMDLFHLSIFTIWRYKDNLLLLIFILKIQVPGSTTYSLTLYYMMSTPIEDSPLLESFVKGDDAYLRSMQLMLHAIALNSLVSFSFHLSAHYNLQLSVHSIFSCFWTSLS